MSLFYNPSHKNFESNLEWCWNRGKEWGSLPVNMSQLIFPVIILFVEPIYLLLILTVAMITWYFVKYRFVSIAIAYITQHMNILKWVIGFAMGLVFTYKQNFYYAGFCFGYPIIAMILLYFSQPGDIHYYQEMFMKKLGFERKDDD